MIFYDYVFAPGHTDHERGIAWFMVAASSIAAASAAIIAGTFPTYVDTFLANYRPTGQTDGVLRRSNLRYRDLSRGPDAVQF